MGKTTKIVNFLCAFLAILILATGFALAKIERGPIISLVIALWGVLSHQVKRQWLSSAGLMGYVGVASWAILIGVSPYLMLAGVTAALVCWELKNQPSNSFETTASSQIKACERIHLTRLGMAISIGLMIGEAGLLLHFNLPFGILFLIAAVVAYSLFKLISIFEKS